MTHTHAVGQGQRSFVLDGQTDGGDDIICRANAVGKSTRSSLVDMFG